MKEGIDGEAIATAQRTRLERPEVELPTYCVTVIEGAERGRSVTVGPNSAVQVHVGKSAACELALSDPEVSRRHVALSLEDGLLRVTDLRSTNGTSVNGVAVLDARVRDGATLSIGATRLRVELVEPSTRVRFPPVESFGRILGRSTTMRRLYPLVQKFAESDVPLVIEGETGTGKELLAESIHEVGPRRDGPFVVFDWQAVDARSVEQVLFGEDVVDRDGTRTRRPGVFEQASGGTLLIDEIGELPLTVQAKLLRAIETREVRPVGGDRWVKVTTRVITVTARDLERLVELGRFREDLYYRLGTGRIRLPPLRERAGDVELLAEHFWRRVAGDAPMPPDLLASSDGYAWPGNVRELASTVERLALVGADAAVAGPEVGRDAPRASDFNHVLGLELPWTQARDRIVAVFERAYIERALAKYGGNVTRAAAASGLARRYFHTLLARHRR